MMVGNIKRKKLHVLSCVISVTSLFLGAVLLPTSLGAQDASGNSASVDPVREARATYYAEGAVPADSRLHEAIVTGLMTGKRPELEDDFLLMLRRTRQGEGTVFVWDLSMWDTRVAGAHLAEFILLVLPFPLPDGEHRILFGDESQTASTIYAIYTSTQMVWTPLFSCVGLAVDGVITFNKNSPDSIEADIDISFEVVEAVEWTSSKYCRKRNIEAQVIFSENELKFWKFPGQNSE